MGVDVVVEGKGKVGMKIREHNPADNNNREPEPVV